MFTFPQSEFATKMWKVVENGPGEGDERTRDLFLMSSFWHVTLILVFYNLLIYWIGPKFMEQYEEPWDTYSYLVWHNLFLVTTNALLGTALFALLLYTRQNLFCQPVGNAGKIDDLIAYLLYSLFLLKLFELIDALTLVAKKLEPPFILVFHHTTIVAIVWVGVKYGPGGSAIFPTLLNSWVHVLIYLHFKFSRHCMSQHQSRRTFIMLYFIQFVIVTVLSLTTIYLECGYPEWVAALSVLYNVILMLVYSRSMWTLWCCAPPPDSGDDSSSCDSSDAENDNNPEENDGKSSPKEEDQGQIDKVKAILTIHDHLKKEE